MKKPILGANPSNKEPAKNNTTDSWKAFLLPQFSPNLLHKGVKTAIPNKKTAIIQPIYSIPFKSLIIAGKAVLIIVASKPAITLANNKPAVTHLICLLVIFFPHLLKSPPFILNKVELIHK